MMSTFAVPGVVAPATDYIVSPGAGLQVQITSGNAFVQQTVAIEGGAAYEGLYMVVNDATANPYNTITAPITNPRIDQVILRVYDIKEQGLGGSSFARLEWLVGSENASAGLGTMGPGLSNPGAAALPDNSLRLAYVLQTVAESSISSGNILNLFGPGSGVTNIATSQSTGSTTYTTLATPDQVTVSLPTNGLIAVWYQAMWQESAFGVSRAAIFIGGNQLEIQQTASGQGPGTQAAATNNASQSAVNMPLTTYSGGLLSVQDVSGSGFTNDVTTGQVVGYQAPASANFPVVEIAGSVKALPANMPGLGGPCYVFAAAGVYTVSVKFKASSGSVTASNRKLWVKAITF